MSKQTPQPGKRYDEETHQWVDADPVTDERPAPETKFPTQEPATDQE